MSEAWIIDSERKTEVRSIDQHLIGCRERKPSSQVSALALGPAGLEVLFSDVSLGQTDPCLQALEKFNKDKETITTEKTKIKK